MQLFILIWVCHSVFPLVRFLFCLDNNYTIKHITREHLYHIRCYVPCRVVVLSIIWGLVHCRVCLLYCGPISEVLVNLTFSMSSQFVTTPYSIGFLKCVCSRAPKWQVCWTCVWKTACGVSWPANPALVKMVPLSMTTTVSEIDYEDYKSINSSLTSSFLTDKHHLKKDLLTVSHFVFPLARALPHNNQRRDWLQLLYSCTVESSPEDSIYHTVQEIMNNDHCGFWCGARTCALDCVSRV